LRDQQVDIQDFGGFGRSMGCHSNYL
jgi:hypothetical protein